MGFIAITIILPFVVAFGILVSPWWPLNKVVNRKKFGCLIGISILASGIVCGLLYFGATRKMHFKEVWNYKYESIRHEEQWTVRASRTREVDDGVDSDGNRKTKTETYYVTETRGPNHDAKDEYDAWHGISVGEYNKYAKLWGQKKTGVNRGSKGDDWATKKSGNIYEASWSGSFETMYPHSEIHSYVNKVRCSNSSVFNLAEPSEAQLKKYPRPVDKENTSPLINYGVGGAFSNADMLLMRRTNALLGRSSQIHSMIIGLPADAGRESIQDILTAWRGPNKNELLIFVGLGADKKINWCEVHSWMDDTTLHAMLRDKLAGEALSVPKVSNLLRELAPKYWNRKSFKDFDYLQIDTHWGWSFAALLVVIGVMVGTFCLVEYKIFAHVDVMGEEINRSRWGRSM